MASDEIRAAEPMHLHILARAIIVRGQPDGVAVLLAQEIGADHTFLPGGHVEPGEGLASALVRELLEELGLSVRVVAYLGAVEHRWPDEQPRHYEINHVFLVEPDWPIGALLSREPHLRFSWCPTRALAELTSSPGRFVG